MRYGFPLLLHVLSVIVWVGGMFFAYLALRPAAQSLDPAVRLPLWARTFARFFPWVWAAVVLLPLTGYWMIGAALGGFGAVGAYVDVMQVLGWIMILNFLHLYFAPYGRLKRAVAQADYADAGKQLTQIRRLIGINLILGLIIVAVVILGKFA